jgi:hypothetical protein
MSAHQSLTRLRGYLPIRSSYAEQALVISVACTSAWVPRWIRLLNSFELRSDSELADSTFSGLKHQPIRYELG